MAELTLPPLNRSNKMGYVVFDARSAASDTKRTIALRLKTIDRQISV